MVGLKDWIDHRPGGLDRVFTGIAAELVTKGGEHLSCTQAQVDALRADNRYAVRGRVATYKLRVPRQNAFQLVFCSAVVSSWSSSAFCQLELGLYSFRALARTSVFLPRSF